MGINNNEALTFWNNAQVIYDSFINKTCEGHVLTGHEALAMEQLSRLLEDYYKLQRLKMVDDIKDLESEDDGDGFADLST